MISIKEAREYYQGSDPAHDFDHVLRVLALAERIGHAEGADMEILRAAVLLHDMARSQDMVGADHAQAAAEKAESILRDKGSPEDRIEKVTQAILSHRFRGGPAPATREAQILYDADKLDAMGAIGIARAYAVAGKMGQRLWTEAPENYELSESDLNAEHSPTMEYTLKLRKLRDTLYTATAHKIAEGRHRYMVEFFQRLEGEVKGR